MRVGTSAIELQKQREAEARAGVGEEERDTGGQRQTRREIISLLLAFVWFLQLSRMKTLFLVIDENSRKQNNTK